MAVELCNSFARSGGQRAAGYIAVRLSDARLPDHVLGTRLAA